MFKPFSAIWLPILLTYASSGAEALHDFGGFSSLGIDLLLLLGDWGHTGTLPSTEVEKTAARTLLASLVRRAWVVGSEEELSNFPEGAAFAQRLNVELFRFLVEAWMPVGVPIPYG